MFKTFPAALAALALLSTLPRARAEPLNPAALPADTRWVIHVDMDAARDTKLWTLVQEKIIAPHQTSFDQKVNTLETITGMQFPRDLHDVTVYGPSYLKEDAAILIHAAVNQETVMELLRRDPDFKSDPHNDHDILTWRDKGKDRLMHGAFFGQDRIILAPTEKLVQSALDALDKKTETLAPNSPLVAPAFPAQPAAVAKVVGPLLFVAGQQLAELHKAQPTTSPLVAQVDSAWFTLTEADNKIVAKINVKAKAEKSAEQIQALASGMKAMLALAASADNADEKAKAASAALDTLIIQRAGSTISAELPITLDALKTFIHDAHIAEPSAAAKPADKLP